MAQKLTIEELVVEGLNSVFDDMMDACADQGIEFTDFVDQVTAAARTYAEDCNQTSDF